MTPRPFQLMFDMGIPTLGPRTRSFKTLRAALVEWASYPDSVRGHAWITENPGQGPGVTKIHMREGKRTDA